MSTLEQPAVEKKAKIDWIRYILIALIVEKILQHCFVTLAFYFDWGGIGATVAVNPNILMILGAIVCVLFMLALWGMISRKKWATSLIVGLALFDILGEFIAQGKIGIDVTVSFLVASALLILGLIYRRKEATVFG
jgi:hypothetical protein